MTHAEAAHAARLRASEPLCILRPRSSCGAAVALALVLCLAALLVAGLTSTAVIDLLARLPR